MSFILEALKKSENKRRKKNVSRSSRSIHEPVPHSNAKFRFRILGISFVLLVNVVLLVWFFSPSRQPASPMAKVSMSGLNQTRANVSEATSPQTSFFSPQSTPESMPVVMPRQPEESHEKLRAQALHAPRSDNKIYNFGQLPVSIQKQIPNLHMSLHAYNRDDATASMVQLNDQIMHEKEMVTSTIRLEQITADGAVLRYDGYRFLVPRRGD